MVESSQGDLTQSTADQSSKQTREWKYKEKQKLRESLTPLQFHITQEKGTEKPHSGAYVKLFETGRYTCVVCSEPIFSSEHKYPSHCGWATFHDTVSQSSTDRAVDTFDGLVRIEVKCSKCGAHIGHVFEDGPKKFGGERYCVNSAALKFVPGSNVNLSSQSTPDSVSNQNQSS
ncbi:peptide methionine sulfoxide reductase MsrB-like [Symsagittifera roscoffensis]|uniref:peptide methionine sulfoxide reductase MsrB-like n=1 Tax=Symsagittifera roscoffensis TaxID=84072 RepID=UPI00307C692A